MQIGQARRMVEVQASALQVNSEDARTSVTVNQTLVNELPLEVTGTVRTPFDLAALTPEAKNTGSAKALPSAADKRMLRNNARRRFDQHVARASEELGGIQLPVGRGHRQFTVDSSGYKAEYGQRAAAS